MRGWYPFVCMVNAATRGGDWFGCAGLLRRDRRAQVGGRTSGQVDFLLVFAKSILPHFFAFFQRQFSTKIPRRMHGQNAYTKQKEEHRSAPRCELLQFSPASCRRL